ncbi:hypothetical protein JX265_004604 [Neoarthrinium moseri]|uniref:Heme haloperoxidase family profile domain-containing protein n=1 Tax=Neoarthrinium moseri TaxID=1658444 RepID=A0A9P9WPJ6_9PEZI|nr:uncharacterized protein JN550_012259 [Neoarthrinium moseri]KAI1858997.1 hypothetical protein JN550_012259 [Neoarthrinium moseri]KAI1874396.1 hypothetical protein JX265_004604 [Neoarthrinium moseri]
MHLPLLGVRLWLTCFIPLALTFPSSIHQINAANPDTFDLRRTIASIQEQVAGGRFVKRDISQPVGVSGKHAFLVPDFNAGDQRGPCPGLNALANHGYIPHNGIATFTQVIQATHEVYNMNIDLGTVLVTLALVFTGNPLSINPTFSIGGIDRRVNNIAGNLGGLIGTPRGLDGSHNFIETDGSLTRDDLYVTGNAWDMNMTKFLEVYRWGGNEALTFDDVVIDDTSTESGMEYKRGWERIPENWYRRPVPWGIVDLGLDVLKWSEKHPFLLDIGGNTGAVNTFTGLDLVNITGGVLNAQTLLEGNNLICFTLEIAKTLGPNSLSTLYRSLSAPLAALSGVVAEPLLDLACPVFEDLSRNGVSLWKTLLNEFPGAQRAGSAL